MGRLGARMFHAEANGRGTQDLSLLSWPSRYISTYDDAPTAPITPSLDIPWLVIVSVIVFSVNVLYVSDLFLLWHDDSAYYHVALEKDLIVRGTYFVARHAPLDSLLFHILANVSPLAARIAVIITGAVPAALLGYLAARLAFRFSPAAAALVGALPFLLTGQWEIFVGVNLSYVVYDLAVFHLCVLIIAWTRSQQAWGAVLVSTAGIAALISDGIDSNALVGPALLWCALFVRPSSIWKAAMLWIAISGATLKGALEYSSHANNEAHSDVVIRVLHNILLPIDFVLPGGLVVAAIGFAPLAIAALLGVAYALYERRPGLLPAMGTAAALYLVPIIIYSAGRGGFSNRYGFLPTAGLALSAAALLEPLLIKVSSPRFSGTAGAVLRSGFSVAAGIIVLVLSVLGFQKAQFKPELPTLQSNVTRLIHEYFTERDNEPIRSAVQAGETPQAILSVAGGVPYLFPYRGWSLGYVELATGRDDVMGFAGPHNLCGNPFGPWIDMLQRGPGGFTQDAGLRIVGFRGDNGRGRELNYVLATDAEALDVDGIPQPWSLYETGVDGSRIVAEGAGRSALETSAASLGLTPAEIALNCGL